MSTAIHDSPVEELIARLPRVDGFTCGMVARELGVTVGTVNRWCDRGLRGVRLKCLRVGRTRLIDRQALNEFLRAINGDATQAAEPPVGHRDVLATRLDRVLELIFSAKPRAARPVPKLSKPEGQPTIDLFAPASSQKLESAKVQHTPKRRPTIRVPLSEQQQLSAYESRFDESAQKARAIIARRTALSQNQPTR